MNSMLPVIGPVTARSRLAMLFLLVLVCHLAGGCANPYLSGFSGERRAALPEGTPVVVYGVNRADPVVMEDFNRRLAEAKRAQVMIGNSTIVSGSALRDEVAAEAGRELGATHVLYTYEYLDSTTQWQSDEYWRVGPSNEFDRFERRSYETTHHWYEYRAYFFAEPRPEE